MSEPTFCNDSFHPKSDRLLGACPRIENLLRKSWIWPDFPIIFVKYAQYSPQIMEKSDSNQLSLATAPILGQAPRAETGMTKGKNHRGIQVEARKDWH